MSIFWLFSTFVFCVFYLIQKLESLGCSLFFAAPAHIRRAAFINIIIWILFLSVNESRLLWYVNHVNRLCFFSLVFWQYIGLLGRFEWCYLLSCKKYFIINHRFGWFLLKWKQNVCLTICIWKFYFHLVNSWTQRELNKAKQAKEISQWKESELKKWSD